MELQSTRLFAKPAYWHHGIAPIWSFTGSRPLAIVRRMFAVVRVSNDLRENRMKIKLTAGILLLTTISAAFGATPSVLPWINDNYPKALTDAKQRKLPIFVEVWAPW
jgi:hypothetical protein